MAAATRYVGPRQPVTCVLLLQPRRIVRMHRIVRVCSRIASSAGASFVWPDDVEEMVYVLVRSELIKQRRKRAASSLTRYVLARLTRRWFLAIRTPWRSQGHTLLWPHAVAMHVSWDVLRAALPGSKIFGQYVRPNSEWQHMLVASVHRGEMWPAEPMRDWQRRVPPAYYYLWRYVSKGLQ